jgi:hypothetical protein
MSTSTPTHRPDGRCLWVRRALPAVLILGNAAGLAACRSAADAVQAKPPSSSVAPVDWDSPATDSGYRCLLETGGASGQCNTAEGIGRHWTSTPARDGGYACLRDNGNAGGQCNSAMGLPPKGQ